MKVAILGYGSEGRSAARWWHKHGHQVTVADQHQPTDLTTPKGAIPPEYATRFGSDYLENLDDFDLVVRTPGLHPEKIHTTAPVTTMLNEFLKRCPAPTIGISGTKGKSTTSTLIAHILTQSGRKTWLAGNTGDALLDILDDIQADDWVVIEESTHMLHDARLSPHIAVLLRVGVDHLDYHHDLASYIASKANLLRFQHPEDILVYRAGDALAADLAAQSAAGTKLSFGLESSEDAHLEGEQLYFGDTEICEVRDIPLLGRHNVENCLAAIAATYPIARDAQKLKAAIQSFQSLRYRLQTVATVDGVRYVDDSIATNPDTTIAAIQTFSEPKVLILGGSDKGNDFAEMAQVIRDADTRAVILMGEMGPRIAQALDQVGFADYQMGLDDMPGLVTAAATRAQSGDVVLLSPGCASFGLFRDYRDRGDQFQAAVQALKKS